MSDEIAPALTSEEWKNAREVMRQYDPREPDGIEYGIFCLATGDSTFDEERPHPDALRAMVALSNAALPDDDPRKITDADMAALDTVGMQDPYVDYGGIERLRKKLAAILPPEN